jgi:hypothetical protein
MFFGSLAALCAISSSRPATSHRGLHPVPVRLPCSTGDLAAALGAISIGLFQTGIVLSTVNARFMEFHALRQRDAMRMRRTDQPRITSWRESEVISRIPASEG